MKEDLVRSLPDAAGLPPRGLFDATPKARDHPRLVPSRGGRDPGPVEGAVRRAAPRQDWYPMELGEAIGDMLGSKSWTVEGYEGLFIISPRRPCGPRLRPGATGPACGRAGSSGR